MKKISVLFLAVLLTGEVIAQDWENVPSQIEEKFVYNVSWTIFDVGTITMTTESIYSNPDLKKITMKLKSNPDIPFISIDEWNTVIMRVSDGRTIYYQGKGEKDGEDVEVTLNYFDNENLAIHKVKNLKQNKIVLTDTINYPKPYFVGSSLIYYARLISDSGLVTNVPTLIDGKFYKTTLNYCGLTENIDTDISDEPVKALKYEVSADWEGKGTAGLSDGYTGWLSGDKDLVVLRAEMDIFLGSIDVELNEWYKQGWVPPTKNRFAMQSKR